MKLPKAAVALFVAGAAAGSAAAFIVPNTHNKYGGVRVGVPSKFVQHSLNTARFAQQKQQRHQGQGSSFIVPVSGNTNNNKRPRSSSSRSSATARRATIEEDIEIVNIPAVEATTATETAAVLSRNDARAAAASYISQYEGESAAAIVYSKLVDNDVTVVNGYSGGAVLPLLDQFHGEHPRHGEEPKKIRWITNSNESSAGHIAEGFAKSAPKWKDGRMQAGVVVATSGPGVTNLITPITDAMCDGVPMVVLCGQAATFAPEAAFQSCPAVDLTRPVTKWSYQITNAAEVPFVMDYAFYVARHGRPGPVFIDLPKDLQNQVITKDLVNEFTAGLVDVGHDQPQPGPVASASKTATHEAPFVALSTHVRPDGQGHYSIHLGSSDQGLSFDVSPDGTTLQPVYSTRQGGNDSYELDMHPSNTIHETKIETDGSTTTRVGKLDNGEVMKEMIDLIKQARKPVIVAGQGCNDAPEELLKFAEALQIPVTTTLHAMGVFDERHPLALNMLGMHGHATPNFMVQECDLLINIGSRFDDRITGALGSFLPEARRAAVEGRGGVIHVDIRKSEHAKQVEPNFFVHSTCIDFLNAMNAELGLDDPAAEPVKPSTATRSWLKYKAELEKEYPVPVPEYRPEMVPVKAADGTETEVQQTKMSQQYVIKKMNEVILKAGRMDDCIFSTGVGIHQMVTAQHITWTQPRQMLSSGSLGTMGVCLGYTIGSKLANPQAICIGIDGDGSFNMTFTELKTVAEQGIPIKMIILDNESQMMVEYWQRLFHAERYLAVRNINPDYTTLADAFRIKNIYCNHAEDLESKLKEFLFEDPDQPTLFHCRVERTPCMPMVAPGKALDDMIHRDESFDVDPSAAPS